jgi:hypothetical protein
MTVHMTEAIEPRGISLKPNGSPELPQLEKRDYVDRPGRPDAPHRDLR